MRNPVYGTPGPPATDGHRGTSRLPAAAQIMRLMTAYQASQALYAATRLGIADLLAEGPRPTQELAAATGTLSDRLRRCLRALAGVGIFCETDGDEFANTRLSEVLMDSHPSSVRGQVTMLGEEQYQAWGQFFAALHSETTAFELTYQQPVFDFYGQNPGQAQTFNRAMREISAVEIQAVLAACDLDGAQRIIDVGGGHGALLEGFLARHEAARGILFDLEQGLAAAREAGLAEHPRIELQAGDFFTQPPPPGDALLLKHILHDWSDAQCRTILQHCREATAAGGRLLVIEMMVSPPNQPCPAKWLDLHMMAIPGGRERSVEEYRQLLAEAGFELRSARPTRAEVWVLEAIAV